MDRLLWFFLTLIIAFTGGIIGKKLKFPAGLLVGSMVFVAVFNVLCSKGEFYTSVRVVLQILSGALVGSRMGMNEVKNMKSLAWSVVALIVSMMLLNVSFAALILLFSDLNPATALFATTPGGASDMGIIAPDFGGDAGIVAILQVSRLVLIYLFIPPAIRYLDKREAAKRPKDAAPREKANLLAASKVGDNKLHFMLMVLAAAVGGLILHFLGVSAGAMIGAMIGGVAFCIAKGRQKYPVKLKNMLQICSGAYIGTRIDLATVRQMPDLIVPLLVMLAGIFAFTFGTSFVLRRVSKLDRSTAMLAATPGGIQEMSLLSEELDADTPKVAVLHTARLVFVILLFPYMIRILLHLMGQL